MRQRVLQPALAVALIVGLLLVGCARQPSDDDSQHRGFYGAVEGGMSRP